MTQKSDSITIRDVAKKAGVSVATVSRYLNHKTSVSEEVAGRVQKVMDELEYTPQTAARSLATRKTYTVGLLSNIVQYGFFGPLVGGLEEIVRQNGYNLLIATYHPESGQQYNPPVGPHNTDGVVVFSNTLDDERLVEWYRMEFPVVLAHRTSPAEAPIPYVTIENRVAARKLVGHLIENHGKRRIAFIHGPEEHEDGYLREKGYEEALDRYSVLPDPRLIIRCHGPRETARQTIGDCLDEIQAPFEAVFASDDDIAVSVVGALNDAGLEVPDDVAVVGFDDQHFASLFIPPLTTVRAPTAEVGRSAGRQLMKLLQGEPADQATILPTEVVIRQSCGCAAPP
jgi:LacI family transcriptional regulator